MDDGVHGAGGGWHVVSVPGDVHGGGEIVEADLVFEADVVG